MLAAPHLDVNRKDPTCPADPVGGKVELSEGDEVTHVDAAQGGVRVDGIVANNSMSAMLAAQYGSSDDSDSDHEPKQGPLPAPPGTVVAPTAKPLRASSFAPVSGAVSAAADNPRPRKRLKAQVSAPAVNIVHHGDVKKQSERTSTSLMFAPPQLLRKAPNTSIEDLDKWNSAGTSKQRKRAKTRGSGRKKSSSLADGSACVLHDT